MDTRTAVDLVWDRCGRRETDATSLSVWLIDIVVRVLDLQSTIHRFDFRPPFFWAILGKLFTHVPLSPSSIIWYRSKSSDALWLGSQLWASEWSVVIEVYNRVYSLIMITCTMTVHDWDQLHTTRLIPNMRLSSPLSFTLPACSLWTKEGEAPKEHHINTSMSE